MTPYEELRAAVLAYLMAREQMVQVRPGFNLGLRGAARERTRAKLTRELNAARDKLERLVKP